MKVQHSLFLLKEEHDELTVELNYLTQIDKGRASKRIDELKSQLNDLEFAIEVLQKAELKS